MNYSTRPKCQDVKRKPGIELEVQPYARSSVKLCLNATYPRLSLPSPPPCRAPRLRWLICSFFLPTPALSPRRTVDHHGDGQSTRQVGWYPGMGVRHLQSRLLPHRRARVASEPEAFLVGISPSIGSLALCGTRSLLLPHYVCCREDGFW